MTRLREHIAKITGFHFSDKIPLSVTFKQLGTAGRFDSQSMMNIVGVLCDYLEELEKNTVKKPK